MGRRLVVLKFVLSEIPVYYISFFKALTGIISKIKALFKDFLWEKGEL